MAQRVRMHWFINAGFLHGIMKGALQRTLAGMMAWKISGNLIERDVKWTNEENVVNLTLAGGMFLDVLRKRLLVRDDWLEGDTATPLNLNRVQRP